MGSTFKLGMTGVVQCSNYPWVGKCVFTVILVYPKSTKLLSVAIHPQTLPYVKFMSSLVTLMIVLLKL